jgi:succinylglutamate desuccinylase
MGGVHGNERAGIEVVEALRGQLPIERGQLVLMLGNLAAIRLGQRFTESNLNRNFKPIAEVAPADRDTVEAQRGQELLPYLEACNSLLDLHEFTDPRTPPFIICERPAFSVAAAIGAPIISFGWSQTEPGGSDGYMHNIGRRGICYELGPRSSTALNAIFGHKVVDRFLVAEGLAEGQPAPLYREPTLVQTSQAVLRTEEHYGLARDFHTFEELVPGELIAVHGSEKIHAEPGQVIIFPEKTPPINTEAFTIGTRIDY